MTSRDAALAIVLLIVAIGVVVVALVFLRNSRRGAALERMGIHPDEERAPEEFTDEPLGTGLRRWLGLAGYRSPQAPVVFVFVTLIAAAAGLVLTSIATASGVFQAMESGLYSIPGDFAQVLVPLVQVAGWITFVLFALCPLLVVRSARRKRVQAMERELPVFLELLATLAEAGLGFDAAVNEILESDHGEGTLADEFRTFQRETLSGVPRVTCLRRLAKRIEIPVFSTFVSSLVQAERGGLGLADVLRVQSDDMRNRRKEAALGKAQALPVKLVFPLVICFLPALFVLTLGPAFYTFLRVADAVQGTIAERK